MSSSSEVPPPAVLGLRDMADCSGEFSASSQSSAIPSLSPVPSCPSTSSNKPGREGIIPELRYLIRWGKPLIGTMPSYLHPTHTVWSPTSRQNFPGSQAIHDVAATRSVASSHKLRQASLSPECWEQ